MSLVIYYFFETSPHKAIWEECIAVAQLRNRTPYIYPKTATADFEDGLRQWIIKRSYSLCS